MHVKFIYSAENYWGNVFYSTFTNVFLFLSRFFTFFNVFFIFLGNVFSSMVQPASTGNGKHTDVTSSASPALLVTDISNADRVSLL